MTSDPNSPQIIAGSLTEQEAAVLVDFLKETGVEARTWGTQLATIYGEVARRDCVQIVVRQSDVERAERALEGFHQSQASPVQ